MAQNILSVTLQQLDGTGATLARRVETITDSAPLVGDFRGLGLLPTTSLTAITLPTAQVRQLWLRNTHATAKVTVTWTPNGGASAVTLILGPNDAIGFWHQATSASYGISALSLTSDTLNATYELFLGG